MAAPYTKLKLHDDWIIEDGDGNTIATVETETLIDHVMAALLGFAPAPPDYPIGVPQGEPELEDGYDDDDDDEFDYEDYDIWTCGDCGHQGPANDFQRSSLSESNHCPSCGSSACDSDDEAALDTEAETEDEID